MTAVRRSARGRRRQPQDTTDGFQPSGKMKRLIFSLVGLYVLGPGLQSDAGSPIRVACIGTSITFGSGIVNRDKNSYPAQLQALLGEKYVVRNFGKSCATASRHGDTPFVKQREYRRALDLNPDIVLIELGANDSKPQNRGDWTAFENDYGELIAAFRRRSAPVRIILLLPPPAFLNDGADISNQVIKADIIPAIQNVAMVSGCEILSLYSLFNETPFYFPDQIHPSSIGAGLIAARLFEAITAPDESYDVLQRANIIGKPGSYFGFRCTDFQVHGRACKIVQPWRAAPGHPWIWRARFWGHEPQTEIALLERGFHVAYCDVAELYGNAEALTIWDHFYRQMVSAGLAPKAVMEGFSRGGLYIYRWAAEYPDRVACIYADAPVLDAKSWPGGKGKSAGNAEEWQRFKNTFNLHNEAEALAFAGNPMDLVELFVQAQIPMLHVCGEADEVVPISENTDLFEQKILALNGRITVIRKPGVNHHPHSLANPQPIVDFILGSTGYKTNFAVLPAPGNEYRSGAGWKNGMDWHAVFEEMNNDAKIYAPIDVLFFGDSITQGMGGEGRSLGSAPGDSACRRAFASYRWLNFGISGDRTQHLLWRVQNGNWQKLHPKMIVVTIGVNNFPSDAAEEVHEGIRAIIDAIRKKENTSKILLVGPLAAKEPDHAFRKKFNQVHQLIAELQDHSTVFYSDMASQLLLPDGRLDPALYSNDGIHFRPAGYVKWATLLKEEIDRDFAVKR